MIRLVVRKLLLMVLILPLLNALGFFYAVSYPDTNPFTRPLRRPDEGVEYSYVEYVQGLLRGDWGQVGIVPVGELLFEPLRNSFILLGAALLIIVLLGPLLGYWSISSRSRRISPLMLVLTTAGASMPGFFLGVAIISAMLYAVLYTSVSATPFPISGFGWDRHLVLPILVLASRPMLQVARVTAGLFEYELQQDYVQVARSKGLSWRQIFGQHVWPNIVSPVVVVLGQSMRLLISGLIIVEALFQWPGVGALFTLVIGVRMDGRAPANYFANPELLAGIAFIFGFMLLVSDVVTSILATRLDPRIKARLKTADATLRS